MRADSPVPTASRPTRRNAPSAALQTRRSPPPRGEMFGPWLLLVAFVALFALSVLIVLGG